MQILLLSIVLLVQICTISYKVFYGLNESTLATIYPNLVACYARARAPSWLFHYAKHHGRSFVGKKRERK